jgi:hypothetical protein
LPPTAWLGACKVTASVVTSQEVSTLASGCRHDVWFRCGCSRVSSRAVHPQPALERATGGGTPQGTSRCRTAWQSLESPPAMCPGDAVSRRRRQPRDPAPRRAWSFRRYPQNAALSPTSPEGNATDVLAPRQAVPALSLGCLDSCPAFDFGSCLPEKIDAFVTRPVQLPVNATCCQSCLCSWHKPAVSRKRHGIEPITSG